MSTTLSIQLNNLLNSPVFEKASDGSLQMTWAWKQFYIGLAGPTTQVLVLAKVTPGGTDGSISLNDYGLVTEFVEPT